MNETILITGAAGRIGSLLATRLARTGRTLRLIDLNADADRGVVAADILDPQAMAERMQGIDAVIHLAGHPSSRDWATVERLNIQGTRTVFEAAVNAGVRRIVYASSIHAVGLYPADSALTADMALAPDSPYGLSKGYGEMLLDYLCRMHGVSGFVLRIASFRPRPNDARELRTWLSPDDMVRLAEASLGTDARGYTVVWGVSANRRAVVDRATWARIGYHPRDEAEDHVEALRTAGIDTDLVSEWPMLGAHFVAPSPAH